MPTAETIDPVFDTVPEEVPNTEENSVDLEDEDAILEALVIRASVPNLAALYKLGKETGLIKPVQEYGTA